MEFTASTGDLVRASLRGPAVGAAGSRKRNPVTLNLVARKKSFAEMAAEYSTLAFVLPVSTLVGWLLGHLLDKAFGTGYLSIAGLILGIVAGFVQLIRQVTRDTHDNDG